jgi:hypothetical protein
LQLTKVLLYDKIVRKILYLLFSVVFLLVFVSFFSQKSLADSCTYSDTEAAGGSLPITQAFTKAFDASVSKCQTAWTSLGRPASDASANCTTNSSSYQTIKSDAAAIAGSNTYAAGVARNKYCAADPKSYGYVTNCTVTLTATCPTTPASGTTTTGDSTSTSTGASVPIGQYGCSFKNDSAKTPVIKCATGSNCKSITPYSTFNSSTNTTENGYCQDAQDKCYVCNKGFQYNYYTAKCDDQASGQSSQTPTPITCNTGESCSYGYGCGVGNPPAPQPLSVCQNGTCKTALGDLPTSLSGLLTRVFSIALSIAGIVALGLIIASGYRLMVSQGNPEQVKGAREQLTAAIIGLLFIIFSLVILQIIGVNILKIPGFG